MLDVIGKYTRVFKNQAPAIFAVATERTCPQSDQLRMCFERTEIVKVIFSVSHSARNGAKVCMQEILLEM